MNLRGTVVLALLVGAGCSTSPPPMPNHQTVALRYAQGVTMRVDASSSMPVDTVTLHAGQHAVIRMVSTDSMMMHLHGYDLKAEVQANGAGEIEFYTGITGRFAVEGHFLDGSARPLFYVEVHPR